MSAEPVLGEGERVIGQVRVYLIAEADGGMRNEVRSDDGDGDALDLATVLGALVLAQNTFLSPDAEDLE